MGRHDRQHPIGAARGDQPVGDAAELAGQGAVSARQRQPRAVAGHPAGADRDPAAAQLDARAGGRAPGTPAGRPAGPAASSASRSAAEPPGSAAWASRISAVTDAAAAAASSHARRSPAVTADAGEPSGADDRHRRDDADDLLGDLDRDGVGDQIRDRDLVGGDHARRVGDERLGRGRRQRPGRLDDRLAERRDRDRDRTRQRRRDDRGDAAQAVAGDRAGDERQRRGPGGADVRLPTLR